MPSMIYYSHWLLHAHDLVQKKELFFRYNAVLTITPDLKMDINLFNDDQIATLSDFVRGRFVP